MKNRLTFFPSRFPDETLHSLLSRYHQLSGNYNERQSLHELLGSHTLVVTSHLPSRLNYLAKVLPEGACDANTLIDEMTVFPYYRPFLSARQIRLSVMAMRGDNAESLKIRLGLVAGRLGSSNSFRYCDECLAEDADIHGQGYWHRAHQLPGVMVCFQHGCALNKVSDEWIHRNRHSLFLPTHGHVQREAAPVPVVAGEFPLLQQLALLSASALQGAHKQIDRAALRDHYLELASRLDLANGSGRLRVNAFCERVFTLLRSLPDFDDFQLLQPATNDAPAWALKLMRKAKGVVHPLKHILLRLCLQDEWGGQQERPIVTDVKKNTCQKLGQPTEPDFAVDHKRLVSLIVNEGKSLRQCSIIMGISVTTLRIAATRFGLSVNSRPKLINREVLQKLKVALSSNPSKADVARQFSVSLVSVYRILAMFPEIAENHRRCIFLCDRQIRRERFLREMKSCNARRAGDYAWLYRHDRAWMKNTIEMRGRFAVPSSPRVNWPLRDKALANEVFVHTRKLLAQIKPIQITKSAIARSMNEMATFDKYLDRLPLTAGALARVLETTQDFQCRRVSWAAKLIKEQGGDLVAWRLMRKAGIKKEFTANVMQLIEAIVSGK